jgi:hypothetical protein
MATFSNGTKFIFLTSAKIGTGVVLEISPDISTVTLGNKVKAAITAPIMVAVPSTNSVASRNLERPLAFGFGPFDICGLLLFPLRPRDPGIYISIP